MLKNIQNGPEQQHQQANVIPLGRIPGSRYDASLLMEHARPEADI
jgi:hypothetical protein